MSAPTATPEEAIAWGASLLRRELEELQGGENPYLADAALSATEFLRLARLGAEVEGWEREWGLQNLHGEILAIRFTSQAEALEDAAERKGLHVVVSRRVSPREPVERSESTNREPEGGS